MAGKIVDFEARRDSQGRLKVYNLPPGDGGGRYEVAGINDRFHPTEAAALRRLVEAGRYDDAEDYAQRHIASYTDAGDRWTPHDAIECYLRDCIFNRGAGGAASIYQMALGVRVDGDVGPITMDAGGQARAAALLPQIRAARERYEREVVGRDERSRFWRGLVNRWNNALVFAEEFLDFGGNLVEPAETREIPGDGETSGEEREERPGNEESALTEEAMAMRESAREEADDAQEAPAEDVSRSRTRGPAEPASTAGMNVRVIPRPLSTRKRGAQPTLVVLHATAGASAISSINHLRSVGLSYHFIIARDGRDSARTRDADASTPIIFQCVDPAHRAAHVGSTIPAPSGDGSINECSIGISLANIQSGGERYTPGQIAALNQLLAHLRRAQPSLLHLTNHALVQPWNRADPLSIDAAALAATHGYTLFRPTAQQIRAHRPR